MVGLRNRVHVCLTNRGSEFHPHLRPSPLPPKKNTRKRKSRAWVRSCLVPKALAAQWDQAPCHLHWARAQSWPLSCLGSLLGQERCLVGANTSTEGCDPAEHHRKTCQQYNSVCLISRHCSFSINWWKGHGGRVRDEGRLQRQICGFSLQGGLNLGSWPALGVGVGASPHF